MFVNKGLGYGYLYNWYAASDAKFAPTDWKVPAKTDFETLVTFLGEGSTASAKLRDTGLINWESPNTDANNSSGFTAIGSGYRVESYIGSGFVFYAWNTTTPITRFVLDTYNSSPSLLTALSYMGCSVRLLYTGTGTPSTMTDYDGNVYDVVKIGTQYWTVQNWKCTHLNDGTALTKVTGDSAWAALTTEGYCAYDNDESYV